MEILESEVKMTKTQAQELKRFSELLKEDYESGFFDFDINRCKRDYGSTWLFRSVMASASGWFSSKNVPFACVYALVNTFVKSVLQQQ